MEMSDAMNAMDGPLNHAADPAQSVDETDERYRLLVEGVTDYAIYMLDPAGQIVSWNTGAQLIKGYVPHGGRTL